MAAVADYGTVDPEKGAYGIYNDFFVNISSNTAGTIYKLKYRIKVTRLFLGNPTSISFERDVEPDVSTSIININPVQIMQSGYFKSQVIGDESGQNIDVAASDERLDFAYTVLRVEVGELYANAAADPPTFRGYDTSNDFYFYNGYEDIDRSASNPDYSNYRDLGWYSAAELKLPSTIKTKYISDDPAKTDITKIQFFSVIPHTSQDYTASNLITVNYIGGVAQTPITTSLVYTADSLISTDGADYVDPAFDKVEQYIEYTGGVSGTLNSEKITFLKIDCTKNERYRVRWINKYGAYEYLNFVGKTTETQSVDGGKIIASSGLNPTSLNFGGIKPLAEPETKPYGQTTRHTITLNSGYLKQEEVDALSDLYKSRNTIIFDPDNNIIPVRVLDQTYKITNVLDELAQVQIRFELANPPKIQIQ